MSKYSDNLKQELKQKGIQYANSQKCDYEEKKSALIFNDIADSFNKESYINITNSENSIWKDRLAKKHSKVKGAKEMQSSNSSDALLMNIFCHPDLRKWKGIRNLFELTSIDKIDFGNNPKNLRKNEGLEETPTEIDMVIHGKSGNEYKTIYVEAKLTESDFTRVKVEKMNKYDSFGDVFNVEELTVKKDKYDHYQLLRNVLAAKVDDTDFILLCDARRPDLIQHLFDVMKCIKDQDLRSRCSFLCWHDVARACGAELRSFLEVKYGIV